ncbi:MAG: ABC transporter substrate-binding protein [Alphaproteobacteria bacterium]|nr:ABC transporter substrate-binding protein [Alphaproteobacteria bacterium]
MKNKKLLIVMGIITAIIIGAIGFRTAYDPDPRPIVRIGVSLPLTGGVAFVGQPAREAAQMALDKWEQRDTRFRYQLIFEDDMFDVRRTAMAGNRLINRYRVRALLGVWNISNSQFRELAHRHDIVFMSCGWGHNTSDGQLVFNNQTPHDEHARAFTTIVRDKWRASRVAFVGQISSGDFAIRDDVLESFTKNNINVVFNESAQYGETDYRMLIQQIRAANPQGLVIIMAPAELQIFMRQWFAAGMNIPITTVDYFVGTEDPSIFNGMYMVTSSFGTPIFKEMFYGHTGRIVNSDCIAPLYDNIDILIYAFENADTIPGEIPSSEAVADIIRNINNWRGAMVENVSVRPDGRIFSPAGIARIENGTAVQLR